MRYKLFLHQAFYMFSCYHCISASYPQRLLWTVTMWTIYCGKKSSSNTALRLDFFFLVRKSLYI